MNANTTKKLDTKVLLSTLLMKAIVFNQYGTPDVLKLADVAVPQPKDDQVLVKHFAVCHPPGAYIASKRVLCYFIKQGGSAAPALLGAHQRLLRHSERIAFFAENLLGCEQYIGLEIVLHTGIPVFQYHIIGSLRTKFETAPEDHL